MAKVAWSLSSTKQQDLGPIIFAPLGLGLNPTQLTAIERGMAFATAVFNTRGYNFSSVTLEMEAGN